MLNRLLLYLLHVTQLHVSLHNDEAVCSYPVYSCYMSIGRNYLVENGIVSGKYICTCNLNLLATVNVVIMVALTIMM